MLHTYTVQIRAFRLRHPVYEHHSGEGSSTWEIISWMLVLKTEIVSETYDGQLKHQTSKMDRTDEACHS